MIALLREALDAEELMATLQDQACGGFCVFEGRVRDHHDGKAVLSLAYECYEAMALRQMEILRAAALQRWNLGKVTLVHRLGPVPIGEAAVWIGVASVHRAEAFEACRYLIDELKVKVPVWKKEVYLSGDAAWVGCGHDHVGSTAA